MPSSIEIVLRGIPRSDELESYIGEEVRKLDLICDDVRTCRVLAQALRRPKQQGIQLAVGLAVTLPGTEIVVNREHAEDIHGALREAFKAAGLQLKEHARRHADIGRRPRGAGSGSNRGP
jgi:ribosome-associated translation inhibitor RaiA